MSAPPPHRGLPPLHLTCLLLGASCAILRSGGRGPGLVEPRFYAFEAELGLRIEVPGDELPSLESPEVALPARAWRGSLVRVAGLPLPDTSIPWSLRFREASLREGPGVAWTQSDLEGRHFTMRSFDDGELLSVKALDGISGPGRDGDLLFPLWAALSPTIPDIKPGATITRKARLPFVLDDGAGLRGETRVTWKRLEPTSRGGRAVFPFRHEQEIEGRLRLFLDGAWRSGGVRGKASGLLELDARSRVLISHELDWDLELILSRDRGGPDGSLAPVLIQKLQGHGSLAWLDEPPSGPSHPSLGVTPPEHDTLLSVLHSASSSLNACFPVETGDIDLDVEIERNPTGTVREARLLHAPEGLGPAEACLRETLGSLVFPADVEDASLLGYHLSRRQERLFPFPELVVLRRDPGPPLLRLPGSATETDRRVVAERLGFDPWRTSSASSPAP